MQCFQGWIFKGLPSSHSDIFNLNLPCWQREHRGWAVTRGRRQTLCNEQGCSYEGRLAAPQTVWGKDRMEDGAHIQTYHRSGGSRKPNQGLFDPVQPNGLLKKPITSSSAAEMEVNTLTWSSTWLEGQKVKNKRQLQFVVVFKCLPPADVTVNPLLTPSSEGNVRVKNSLEKL